MAEALYTREILRLAMSLASEDRLGDADGEATERSAVCGSEMTVQLKLDEYGKVAHLTVLAKACAMGQASAAILQKHASGMSEAKIRALQRALSAFFDGNGDLPDTWPELLHLGPAKNHPARHSAIMLPYKALLAGFRNAAVNSDSD